MKNTRRILVVVLIICLTAMIFVSCGANAAKPYIGVWDGYEIAAGNDKIVFSDFEGIVDLEYTVEFTEDGKYEMHYLVEGEEGKAYPKYGTYTVENEKMILDDGYGEIVNGELVLYFDDGQVEHRFTKAS